MVKKCDQPGNLYRVTYRNCEKHDSRAGDRGLADGGRRLGYDFVRHAKVDDGEFPVLEQS
jgi:hypothetical protein